MITVPIHNGTYLFSKEVMLHGASKATQNVGAKDYLQKIIYQDTSTVKFRFLWKTVIAPSSALLFWCLYALSVVSFYYTKKEDYFTVCHQVSIAKYV